LFLLPNGICGAHAEGCVRRLVFDRAHSDSGVPERTVPHIIRGIEGFFLGSIGNSGKLRFSGKTDKESGHVVK
jgi:hypothetical protein